MKHKTRYFRFIVLKLQFNLSWNNFLFYAIDEPFSNPPTTEIYTALADMYIRYLRVIGNLMKC